MRATAQAQPNIALVKYWGKRDSALNLPAAGSLSVTLDSLRTRTTVELDPALDRDELWLADARDTGDTEDTGEPREPVAQTGVRLERVSRSLDLLRDRAGSDLRARVSTHNTFPTAAGLASSASGFAALVLAADAALGLGLSLTELSVLARRGSGSAARSLFGGFVEMLPGTRADGQDACAAPVLEASAWPLEVVVAVTSQAAKATGSAEGMERSRATSPYYDAWVTGTGADVDAARAAVLARDFEALAELSEHSCLKMHAVMLATRPGLLYWNGATMEALHRVRALREQEGLGVFFTVDAGPQVKAVCLPGQGGQVARALAEVPGVQTVLTTGLGQGAQVLAGDEVQR